MKKDYIAAFFASFSIALEAIVDGLHWFFIQEKEIVNGAEYDQEQDTQTQNSGDQLQA